MLFVKQFRRMKTPEDATKHHRTRTCGGLSRIRSSVTQPPHNTDKASETISMRSLKLGLRLVE